MLKKNTLQLLQEIGVQSASQNTLKYVYGGVEIHLEGDREGKGLYLFYCVGNWPAQPSTTFTQNILNANLLGMGTKGGHLGLYKEQKTLIYSLRLDTENLNEHVLQNSLQTFAVTALDLVQKVQEWSKNSSHSDTKLQDIPFPLQALRV